MRIILDHYFLRRLPRPGLDFDRVPPGLDPGAARTFPAGDASALHGALQGLLEDRAALEEMAGNARAAAAGAYSWDAVAAATLELYESLLRQNRRR